MSDFLQQDAAIRAAIGAYSMVIKRGTGNMIWPRDIVALLEGLMNWCNDSPVDFDVCLGSARLRVVADGD